MNRTRENVLKIFLQAKEMPGYSLSWEKHSFNTAFVAERIVKAIIKNGGELEFGESVFCDLDNEKVDLAYAAGLLHDIGRCVGIKVGLRHPILGYELLRKEKMEKLAQISMTHTYYGYKEINRMEFWEELSEGDMRVTRDYMERVCISDLDLLIQLADHMGHSMGIMTVSDRFADILVRHGIRSAGDHLRELFRIKQYFDKKAGINIYELFRDEIIRTTMMEPNGVIGAKQNVTEETEDNL